MLSYSSKPTKISYLIALFTIYIVTQHYKLALTFDLFKLIETCRNYIVVRQPLLMRCELQIRSRWRDKYVMDNKYEWKVEVVTYTILILVNGLQNRTMIKRAKICNLGMHSKQEIEFLLIWNCCSSLMRIVNIPNALKNKLFATGNPMSPIYLYFRSNQKIFQFLKFFGFYPVKILISYRHICEFRKQITIQCW